MTASKPEVKIHDKLYINGQWTEPAGKGFLDVINSTTEEVMGRVPDGTPEDADRAVAAARAAFEAWAQLAVAERATYLQRIAEGLQARQQEIAATIASEVGMPLPLAAAVQAGLPALVCGSYANLLGEYKFEEQVGNSLVVKEPVGVVGCITPRNYPVHRAVANGAPSIAAGCTVVL